MSAPVIEMREVRKQFPKALALDISAHYGSGTAGFADGNIGYIDNTSIHTVMSDASVVPEPSTYALMALGAGAIVMAIRRKRTA